MKKFYSILLFIPIMSLAQTADSVHSYYPLQTGNYWEYEHISRVLSFYDTLFFSIEVIGDTVMPNNFRYKILQRKSIPDTTPVTYTYERIDSITLNTYRYFPGGGEVLQDSLKSQKDDLIYNSWRSNLGYLFGTPIVCYDVIGYIILGIDTGVKCFKDTDYTTDYTFKLANDLGLIYEYNTEMFFYREINLLYAIIDNVSYGIPLSLKYNRVIVPEFQVYQNYPNPFNSRTVLPFNLPRTINLEIKIFDLSGREIFMLFNGRKQSGYHEIIFDGNQLSSGVYYYQIRSKNYSQTKKLILLK